MLFEFFFVVVVAEEFFELLLELDEFVFVVVGSVEVAAIKTVKRNKFM